jgi:hypothetical protein
MVTLPRKAHGSSVNKASPIAVDLVGKEEGLMDKKNRPIK